MYPSDRLTLALEVPDDLLGPFWSTLQSCPDLSDLFYAVWAYLLYSETCYLEDLAPRELEEELPIDEMLGLWLDQAFLHWEELSAQIREARSHNLTGVLYHASSKSLYLSFIRREPGEPFYLADLPDYSQSFARP